MTNQIDLRDTCCVALELRQSSWVCAFSPPDGGETGVHKIAAGNVDRLIHFLDGQRAKAEREASRPLNIVLRYEAGYDGFWLARLLNDRGTRTIVFDPASFLMRQGSECQ